MGLFSIFWVGADCCREAWLAEPWLAATPAFAQVGFGAAAFTRFASEGWWARQDSNLQPDRYERPALTIELQAPPLMAAGWRLATLPGSFTGRTAIRQCRG
jgi:hypothetical protein